MVLFNDFDAIKKAKIRVVINQMITVGLLQKYFFFSLFCIILYKTAKKKIGFKIFLWIYTRSSGDS